MWAIKETAIQYYDYKYKQTYDNGKDLIDYFVDGTMYLNTLEGAATAHIDTHYIVVNVGGKGERYFITKAQFKQTYNTIDEKHQAVLNTLKIASIR
jgi:hypothetical protein